LTEMIEKEVDVEHLFTKAKDQEAAQICDLSGSFLAH